MSECSEDKEMSNLANEELTEAIAEENRLRHLLLKLLLPKDDADDKDCILEVRAGDDVPIYYNCIKLHDCIAIFLDLVCVVSLFLTNLMCFVGIGGDEASLFAMDIFNMYRYYLMNNVSC